MRMGAMRVRGVGWSLSLGRSSYFYTLSTYFIFGSL